MRCSVLILRFVSILLLEAELSSSRGRPALSHLRRAMTIKVRRHRFLPFAAAAVLAGILTVIGAGCTQQQVMEMNLALGINQMRADNGLSPLTIDPSLSQVARYRAQDMASRSYFGHAPPDGCDYRCLFTKSSIPMAWTGEVIAWNNYSFRTNRSRRPSACGSIVPGISASLPIAASRAWERERQQQRTGGSITWRYSRDWRRAVDPHLFDAVTAGFDSDSRRLRASGPQPAEDSTVRI